MYIILWYISSYNSSLLLNPILCVYLLDDQSIYPVLYVFEETRGDYPIGNFYRLLDQSLNFQTVFFIKYCNIGILR